MPPELNAILEDLYDVKPSRSPDGRWYITVYIDDNLKEHLLRCFNKLLLKAPKDFVGAMGLEEFTYYSEEHDASFLFYWFSEAEYVKVENV